MENNNELMHHGVPGQKWGVRRYQNKDGTLTPRGKKRYEKELAKLSEEERVLKNKIRTQAKLNKLTSKRQELDDMKSQLGEPEKKKRSLFGKKEKHAETSEKSDIKVSKLKKKKLEDMTDEELSTIINRMNLEKRYTDLTTKPDATDKAKSWISEAFTNAASDLGKQTIKHFGAKFINKVLEEEAVYANNKKK